MTKKWGILARRLRNRSGPKDIFLGFIVNAQRKKKPFYLSPLENIVGKVKWTF
jgi:hypothetical protein